MRRRPNMADEMLARMRDGRAHDDAMLALTATNAQTTARRAGAPSDPALDLALAEVLASGRADAHARCAAMATELAKIANDAITFLADGLGYDVDGLLAGMAQVRPPYRDA